MDKVEQILAAFYAAREAAAEALVAQLEEADVVFHVDSHGEVFVGLDLKGVSLHEPTVSNTAGMEDMTFVLSSPDFHSVAHHLLVYGGVILVVVE